MNIPFIQKISYNFLHVVQISKNVMGNECSNEILRIYNRIIILKLKQVVRNQDIAEVA